MSPSAPRRTQNHQPPTANNPPAHDSHGYPHAHGHGHGHVHDYGHGHARTRSRQLQAEAQQEQQQQQQQQQQRLVPSDYESDTPQYMAPQPAMSPATMAARTNTELNLAVLRRYLPSITAILSIASNGVVYTFQPPSGWGRTTLEGPMFICSQRKSPSDAQDTACLFIINRKGLQNFVLDLDTVGNFELAGDLFIFQLGYAAHELQLETGESVKPQVLGLWSYAEDKSDREANAALINDLWSRALATRNARVAASDPAALAALAEGVPAARATSRRLSVSDLFSAYNGTTIPARGP